MLEPEDGEGCQVVIDRDPNWGDEILFYCNESPCTLVDDKWLCAEHAAKRAESDRLFAERNAERREREARAAALTAARDAVVEAAVKFRSAEKHARALNALRAAVDALIKMREET